MSCTSFSSGNQVDGSPLAIHTEAVRVFQGFLGWHLSVKNESFLYDLEYFRLRVDRKITKIYIKYECNEIRNALDWMGKYAEVPNLYG